MVPAGPAGKARARPVKTSLLLEVFLYFGGIYGVVWWLAQLALFVYKGLSLPYPTNNFTTEFVLLWLYLPIEPVRLFTASKGNKTETQLPLVFSILLSLPLIALHTYYMQFQTYVLRLEVILNAAALFFIGVQDLIALVKAPTFMMSR
mmetsp:Transcript_29991/g.76921  ORF Transcript_29991/g.76921 Transcript_29991/m.76921 type:complete len:148 (+) Transcript_29991:193-636(+)|eukprot:jgi/Tetstr1/430843/TSEL_020624.t1